MDRRDLLAEELKMVRKQHAEVAAKANQLAAVIAYLEAEVMNPESRRSSRDLEPIPTVELPRPTRGIPGAVREILAASPRHIGVEELYQRLRALGFTTKRASIPRSLARDKTFRRFPDGWGLAVSPLTVRSGGLSMNVSDTLGSQLWSDQSTMPTVAREGGDAVDRT